MKLVKNSLLLFLLVVLVNCDPELSGNMKIINESDHILKFKFEVKHDSTFVEIPPHTDIVIVELSGLGNKKTASDCCPCLAGSIIIKSLSGTIKKDPEVKENWIVPNKSKLKKFCKKRLKCEFHVTNADI